MRSGGPRAPRGLLALTAALTLGACNRPIDTEGIREPSACAQSGRSACEAACEAGDGPACLMASISYGEAQRETMIDYELQACERGVAQACHFYANNWKRRDETLDLPRAREYSWRACKGGDVDGCRWLIKDGLGPADDNNNARQMRDPTAARNAWAQACTQEPTACAGLADLETLGLGGPKAPDDARRHYTIACDAEYEKACHNLETVDPELRLHRTNYAMMEFITTANPDVEMHGMRPGDAFLVRAVICFEAGSFNPVHISISQSSDSDELDTAVIDAMRHWRARPRAPFPAGIASCMPMKFDFRTDPHIRVKFGTG